MRPAALQFLAPVQLPVFVVAMASAAGPFIHLCAFTNSCWPLMQPTCHVTPPVEHSSTWPASILWRSTKPCLLHTGSCLHLTHHPTGFPTRLLLAAQAFLNLASTRRAVATCTHFVTDEKAVPSSHPTLPTPHPSTNWVSHKPTGLSSFTSGGNMHHFHPNWPATRPLPIHNPHLTRSHVPSLVIHNQPSTRPLPLL